MELLITMLITLVTGLVVEFTTGMPRIILGAAFLLFFPGYTVMAALFPRRDSMQGVERVVLSLVLSVALVPLAGLALNYTPWGIRLEPIYITIASLIFVASIIALYRRQRLDWSQRFEPRLRLRMPHWGTQTKLDKAISLVLVLMILGAAGALFYVVTTPRAGEHFTDFYLLGSEGKAKNYPGQLVLGDKAEVTVGIVNHEQEYTNYKISVTLSGEHILDLGPIGLANEAKWQQKVVVVPTEAGEHQKVMFLLFKEEASEPYLTLHLWLDVK